MALAHEPADVSEHVVTHRIIVGVKGAQLTGFPTVCSARAAAVVAATPQPMDDGDWPMMAASWVVIVVVTGGELPAPAGCV
jgi:hypothetical protein